jgi:dephospho-CoA kinase
VVGCSEETQVKRMVDHRGMNEEQARLRISRQMSLIIKKKLADIYVDNEDKPEEMFVRTLRALNKVLELGKK